MNPATTPLGFCPICGKPADYDSSFSNRLAGLIVAGTYCGDHILEKLRRLYDLTKQLEKAKKLSIDEAVKHQQKVAANIQRLMKAGEMPATPVADNLTRHTQ